MVVDPPAHRQLPTELGVVHFGLTSHVIFFRDLLHAQEEENMKAISSAIKFFHVPVVNCFVVPKAVSGFQRGQKRKGHGIALIRKYFFPLSLCILHIFS